MRERGFCGAGSFERCMWTRAGQNLCGVFADLSRRTLWMGDWRMLETSRACESASDVQILVAA